MGEGSTVFVLLWGKGALYLFCSYAVVQALLTGQEEDPAQLFPIAGFGMEL